jgi:hypothetical protein
MDNYGSLGMLPNQTTAMILSIAIETPLAVFLVQRTQRLAMEGLLLVVIVAVCATVFTHPIVWAGNQILSSYWAFPWRATIVETFAILTEAMIYEQVLGFAKSRSFQISVITNLASFSVGLWWFSLG